MLHLFYYNINLPPIFVISVKVNVTNAPLFARTVDKTPGAGRLAPYGRTFIETIAGVTPSGQVTWELEETVML